MLCYGLCCIVLVLYSPVDNACCTINYGVQNILYYTVYTIHHLHWLLLYTELAVTILNAILQYCICFSVCLALQ